MAKTCWLEREKRKQKTVEKYAKLRTELKANKDYVGLSMLPRDSSPTRLELVSCDLSPQTSSIPGPGMPSLGFDVVRHRC
jgi:hypothetical protein